MESKDVQELTRVVYGEARGESDEGKKAVAFTVINRSKKSGQSIAFEATKKSQFAPRDKITGNKAEEAAWDKCHDIAKKCIEGSYGDPTGGATFFYSGGSVPSWAKGKEPCASIGGHKFFKGIPPY
eukprot:TRINITY_DN505_c0_g1_i7.p2 TRINITY_DN505_c0_g1~~TRINITY_DN505_c0_g1_i7.p2  ORF type:complete len:126 (-),score=21.97 TRINITY_DN505_c0_g1_i7:236-613(-)